ncbi:hypothetical protein V9L05_06005 [Bernardetia sp. Wsw4-3y2]|uniref:hypothetical protein n=1 Tax=Bernardetia sp. Wsw4-3y2 TaxID=3127471 RepID=UPI0030CD93E3
MEELKTAYLRVIILLDDISNYHKELENSGDDLNKKFRLLKDNFLSLDNLRQSFNYFDRIIKQDKDLILRAKSLKKRLEFTNHLRNKISGHLDENLLQKAVQWEPHIFSIKCKEDSLYNSQVILTYKTLLESAINSYIDLNSNQKVFGTEIDLFYEPNRSLFFNYVGELNDNSITFLKMIKMVIEEKTDFLDFYQVIAMCIKAGETDFNLRK